MPPESDTDTECIVKLLKYLYDKDRQVRNAIACSLTAMGIFLQQDFCENSDLELLESLFLNLNGKFCV